MRQIAPLLIVRVRGIASLRVRMPKIFRKNLAKRKTVVGRRVERNDAIGVVLVFIQSENDGDVFSWPARKITFLTLPKGFSLFSLVKSSGRFDEYFRPTDPGNQRRIAF